MRPRVHKLTRAAHVLIGSEEKQGYPTATKAMMASYAAKTGLHLILGAYLYWENRRRDRLARDAGEDISDEDRRRLAEQIGMVSGQNSEWSAAKTSKTDATEWHNPYFRYEL